MALQKTSYTLDPEIWWKIILSLPFHLRSGFSLEFTMLGWERGLYYLPNHHERETTMQKDKERGGGRQKESSKDHWPYKNATFTQHERLLSLLASVNPVGFSRESSWAPSPTLLPHLKRRHGVPCEDAHQVPSFVGLYSVPSWLGS